MNFKKGDRVKFLNEVGEGRVVSVTAGIAKVEDEHGFILDVNENELISIDENQEVLYNQYETGILQKLESEYREHFLKAEQKFSKKNKKNSPQQEFLEIDLHINELVDKIAHLTNHQIVLIQVQYFEEMLERGRQEHYQKVIFIHGVGAGVLRAEIRHILKGMSRCEFVDADYSRYGQGATEVNLWYN